jgi:radical SAM protein with 4Fe4S-binding SPASM domain
MSVDEFNHVLNEIAPYTNYVYLHVLGEPLLHPHIGKLLESAKHAGLYVNITTNGSLLKRNEEILLANPVRQINISLHDAEENIDISNWDNYLKNVLDFSQKAAAETYINLRLWNEGVSGSLAFIDFCKQRIIDYFELTISDLSIRGQNTGVKLSDHIFLQTAPRFDWPDGETQRNEQTKTCYALRDQIAILVDGTIVPCCIDADGALKLGNIFTDNLGEVLQSSRAQKIRTGFINHTITEDFCKSCGFMISK